MPISKIKTGSITADSITEAKIADAAIENEHLNSNIITGFTELAEEAADGDFLIVYDTSTGSLKKIQRSNVRITIPIVTSISPTNVDSKDSATTTTFIVTGSGFDSGVTAKLISNGGTEISFNTVTRNSATQLTCVLNNALVTAVTDEPYDIKVTNGSGIISTLSDQINVDQRPVFVTAAGSLGTQRVGTFTATVEATDPESAGAVRYDVVGGTLPTGITLNISTGVISGSITPESSDTTYNFTIQASDVDSNVSFRDFSITLQGPQITSFTASGTFSVPSGVTAVDVLVVAGGGSGGQQHGGGGGAGGLIFRPGFTVTPGGTVSVTVGCGGAASSTSYVPAPLAQGQDSVFGTLTAKGGGYGSYGSEVGPGGARNGSDGGSAGGGGHQSPSPTGNGTATQPTQPGDSGTYGFGNPGGARVLPGAAGGGGGGAGAAGQGGSQPNGDKGGDGGIGLSYTIADGTTPVYYSGGGGGGSHGDPAAGTGGQGGGGDGSLYTPGSNSQSGTANRGGGGGGTGLGAGQGTVIAGGGGKGIVIVKF